MGEFKSYNAKSLDDALELLQQHKDTARIICGGTDTMVRLHLGRLAAPVTFINVRDIKELSYIKCSNGRVQIGANTTMHKIAMSDVIRENATALFLAANDFADPTIRNSASIAGNLGNASPSADSAPPLLVYCADVIIQKKGGSRSVPINEFFTGVGKTVLEPGEMITSVEFDANPNASFYKLGLRNSMAISLVNIAAAVNMESDGTIANIAVGVGAVAPTPVRAKNAEAVLKGKKLTPELMQEAMQAINNDISPITDVRGSAEYRRLVAGNLLRKVVYKACGICENEEDAANA